MTNIATRAMSAASEDVSEDRQRPATVQRGRSEKRGMILKTKYGHEVEMEQ